MHIRNIFVALAILCAFGTSQAGINKKFFKKAAEKVWSMESEGLFDAQKPIPDSISAGQSAVIIARHDDFVGNRVEQNTIYSASGRTNRTSLAHARRSMVKLLDESAVEFYGDFEFGSTHEKHSYSIEPDRRADRAFGVRIHKPDGSIREIDVDNALEVSDGKDGGKNKKFKLAIPGLEVGDVIEYFYYTVYENEDGDIELVDVMLADRYPVMARLMTGKFDPTLTIELKSYNGAPLCARMPDKDSNSIRLFCENMPPVSFRLFLYEESQLPFIRLNTINHHDLAGEFTQRAKNARTAGIYQNLPGKRIQTEAMENIGRLAYVLWKSNTPISHTPGRATGMVKDYVKAHPDATPRDIADAAVLAVRYHNFTAKPEDYFSNSLLLSLFHNTVMENLNVLPREKTGIAFANARDEVPLDEMSKWNQTTFMSYADDVPYDLNAALYYAPGEVRGLFQGVPAIRITGRLRDHTYEEGFENFTLPDRKFSGNKAIFNTVVSLNPDDPTRLNINRNVSLAGSTKSSAVNFTDKMEWIRDVEDFFAIPESKRYKSKTYSADSRKAELAAAITEECEINLGVKPDTITDFRIIDRGILPGNATMNYSMDCEVTDLVEDFGDGISIHVGKLVGKPIRIDEHERERLLDALLPTAATDMYLLTLNVPEGYTVDETALADLNRQTANSVGQFIVQAKLNDDGNVELQCVNRLRYHSVALQAWPLLRDLCDAAADFADASIVLTRK